MLTPVIFSFHWGVHNMRERGGDKFTSSWYFCSYSRTSCRQSCMWTFRNSCTFSKDPSSISSRGLIVRGDHFLVPGVSFSTSPCRRYLPHHSWSSTSGRDWTVGPVAAVVYAVASASRVAQDCTKSSKPLRVLHPVQYAWPGIFFTKVLKTAESGETNPCAFWKTSVFQGFAKSNSPSASCTVCFSTCYVSFSDGRVRRCTSNFFATSPKFDSQYVHKILIKIYFQQFKPGKRL